VGNVLVQVAVETHDRPARTLRVHLGDNAQLSESQDRPSLPIVLGRPGRAGPPKQPHSEHKLPSTGVRNRHGISPRTISSWIMFSVLPTPPPGNQKAPPGTRPKRVHQGRGGGRRATRRPPRYSTRYERNDFPNPIDSPFPRECANSWIGPRRYAGAASSAAPAGRPEQMRIPRASPTGPSPLVRYRPHK